MKLPSVILVIYGWIHIVCNDISDAEYECPKTEDDPWYCLVCFLKYNLNNVPFTQCDNSELNNINTYNSTRFASKC